MFNIAVKLSNGTRRRPSPKLTPTAGPLMAAIEGFQQLKIASTKRPLRKPELAKTPAPWFPDVLSSSRHPTRRRQHKTHDPRRLR